MNGNICWTCISLGISTRARRSALLVPCLKIELKMATGNQFNLYTTYNERFLALSVSIMIRVGKFDHQLELETPRRAPVLRYRDITFTSECIHESLRAVCPVLGVHNVARVRRLGSLLLFEVDFTELNALERFCKSLSSGEVQKRLQDRLKKYQGNLHSPEQDIDVILKLHLVLPNAEKKSVASREVTTDNYKECFMLIKESALFEFQSLNITHDAVFEETTQPDMIGIGDLHELFRDLLEVMPNWFSVGIFLRINDYLLEAIRMDNHNRSRDCLREMLATWLRGGSASPGVLVQALISAGYFELGKKMAVKHGVMTTVSRIAEKHNGWVEKVPSGKKMWNKADCISRTELQQRYPNASRFTKTDGNIAAIHFGATFCSLAFALVGNPDLVDIRSVEISTVRLNGYYTRVPIAILLRQLESTNFSSCDDMPVSRTCNYEVVSFGYDAMTQLSSLKPSQRSKYLYFEQFKIRLQQDENVHRNMTITSLGGKKFYLVEVIAFVLKHLKCQLEDHLARTQQPLKKSDDFDWVITVPAIWKAQGKRMMREAAYMAGLTSADPGITSFLEVSIGVPRPSETNPDKLTLALEPEAVAIQCQTLPLSHLAYQSLMNGPLQSDRYMVIDIGECTVDVTVYRHDQGKSVRVITPPAGNACGGTMVNREFSMFLQEIVEDKPDFARFTGRGNRFEWMAALDQLLQKYFEEQKTVFGDTASGYGEEPLTDNLAIRLPRQFTQFYGLDKIEAGIAALNDDRVELEDDIIYIAPSKFASFFAPAIQSILECIENVFERIKEEVDTIYLVGEFGGLKYTHEKISSMTKAKFPCNKIQIVVPKDHKLAVAQGAVKYRLKPDVIHSRVMDASYGTDFAPEYNPLLHDGRYAGLDHTGTPRVKDVYIKFVEKGEQISSDKVITAELYPLNNSTESMTICLYSSFDKGVKYITTPDGNPNPSIHKIGELIINMPNPEKLPREERQVELTMDFSHEEIQIRARYR